MENTQQAFLGLPKRDEPCGRCGWKYKGFHICFDATKPVTGEEKSPEPRQRAANTPVGAEKNKERNKAILAEYKAGAGLRKLAMQHRVGYQTVMNLIRDEEKRTGETIMRPAGRTQKAKEKTNELAST